MSDPKAVEIRPKIHIFRIICIVLPYFTQSMGMVVFYGLFTSMFMMLGMTDKPWFTPMTWVVSPIFGLTVPFYGAWNDSLKWIYRRRSMLIVSHVLLTISFIFFELCHLQASRSLAANVAFGLIGFVLFFLSQCPGPTAFRSLLYDVLGSGQEMMANTTITIVGTFGSLSGGLFVAYVPQPYFYSLIFIFLTVIPPLFAGKEEWYLKKEDSEVADAPAPVPEVPIEEQSPEAQAAAKFAKMSAFRKIWAVCYRYLKGGPMSRAALCMFLYGVAGYGMLTIATDMTAKIIYRGNPVPGPPIEGSPYGSFDDYMEGVQMSAFVGMVSSIVSVVLSFTIFPILKFFGFKFSLVTANFLGALLNLVWVIPRFDQWTRSMIWIRFVSIPFSAIQAAVGMSVPYIVVNESITSDRGLYVGVITCFYILGCFVPTISNMILSAAVPEFSGGRHQYQWYCLTFLIYGLILTAASFLIQHGELYEFILAAMKKQAAGSAAEKGEVTPEKEDEKHGGGGSATPQDRLSPEARSPSLGNNVSPGLSPAVYAVDGANQDLEVEEMVE